MNFQSGPSASRRMGSPLFGHRTQWVKMQGKSGSTGAGSTTGSLKGLNSRAAWSSPQRAQDRNSLTTLGLSNVGSASATSPPRQKGHEPQDEQVKRVVHHDDRPG